MTDPHDQLRPGEAPIDALLRERVGHEAPPDLTRTVAERYARGDAADVAAQLASTPASTQTTSRPLLAAAVVLLGIGAVTGTIWSTQQDPHDGPGTAQTVHQPEPANEQDPKPAPKQEQDPKGGRKQVDVEIPLNDIGNARREPGPLSMRLRVLDQNGGPIQDFRVQVLTATKNLDALAGQRNAPKERFGVVDTLRDVARHPRDFEGDFTRIEGLWPGRYVVVVTDRMHARTISAPFVVGGDDVDLVVTMSRGGRVRGVVLDDQGKPVAGAEVATAAPQRGPDLAGHNPFAKLLERLVPDLHTQKTVRTRADGSFDLDRLMLGEYVLRARHLEFCASQRDGVRVTASGDVQLTFRLEPGAVVHGVVRKDGKPLAGVAIQISTVVGKGETPKTWRVRSDAEGRYRAPTRLPAGNYKITGFVEGDGAENPFEKLLQLKRSERTFEIGKGGGKVEQNLDIR